MKLQALKNSAGARRPRKRVGRGEGSGHGGGTCGKGHKGQKARSGCKTKPGFEGGQMRFIRRVPKRGFTNPTTIRFTPINVVDLARFDDSTTVDFERLVSAGLLHASAAPVKILGTGDLNRKLTVRADAFSASARAKIEAAGGTCELIAQAASGADSQDSEAKAEEKSVE